MGSYVSTVSLEERRLPAEDNSLSDNERFSHKQLTEELRSYLMSEGADLVGFGSIERLDGAPEILRPQRYLPDAVSMISIAIHINEAVCDLIARNVREGRIPPSYHSFQLFTLTRINPELDRLAYLGAKFLEDRGYRAYPFPANMPHTLKPSKEYPGGPGDVSHKHVAVACGLGQFGWHNLILTPQFGARQKFTSIATNAPLTADSMLEGRPCDPERCGFRCARACPTGAIPECMDERVCIEMDARIVEYAKLRGWQCRWGCSGMLKVTGGYKNIPMPREEPNEEKLLEYKAMMDPWQNRLTNLTGLLPYCGRCLCVCPTPAEREG